MSFEIASSITSVPLGQPIPGPRRLGSHTVDKACAHPSRLGRLGQFITQTVRALGSYVVESVKIARMSRADKAVYRAGKEVSRQVGGLLGALSHRRGPGTAGHAVAHGSGPAWNKPYDPPRDLDHILNTPQLLADFKRFSQSEFNSENILFAEAATSFCRAAQPSLAQADALIRDYVEENAENQINISSSQRAKLLAARHAPGSDDALPSQDLMDAMKEALEEVGKLILSDTRMRFIECGGNPRQSSSQPSQSR